MHYHLRTLSLATATLLLSLTSPVLPLTLKFEPLVVQAQTTQDRATEARQLLQKGSQQYRQALLKEALETFQQALALRRAVGDRITLREMQNWSLKNVDLVVLSACETGLGGKLGNGEEILGLGYQMQQAGARAAVASLWSVSDGGTQALMNAFYAGLKSDNLTKAEALRQAQIALITNNYQALGEQRSIGVEAISDRTQPSVQAQLSHPYYWASFILIGNGL